MPPSPTPPVPVSATYSTGTTVLTVTFNEPIVPGGVVGGNWIFNHDPALANRFYGFPPPVAAGSSVSGATVPFGPVTPGGPSVTYLAAVPDIISVASGLPAAAFADFPVTIIP